LKDIHFETWIDATAELPLKEFRQAVHIVITAISLSPTLPAHLVIKGGILLAIAHHGLRHTRDIDFSTEATVKSLPIDAIRNELDSKLIEAVEMLQYDLNCRIQFCELRPPGKTKNWPTYIMKIGYAPYSNNRRYSRLMAGNSPTIVKVECSYNEVMTYIESLVISPGRIIKAYAIVDIIAEKMRALIQQPIRNRYRRQDVYDLYMLLQEYGNPSQDDSHKILSSLKDKARSRNIVVSRNSLSDTEVKERALKDYGQLHIEVVGQLPSFEEAFSVVESFYERLPWSQ